MGRKYVAQSVSGRMAAARTSFSFRECVWWHAQAPVRLLALSVLAAAWLAATACGGNDASRDPSDDERDNASASSPTVPGVFFANWREEQQGPSATPDSLTTGRLLVDDEGCFRLDDNISGSRSTLIWPPNYAPSVQGDEIQIRNGEGQVVAQAGDEVELGGGEIPSSLKGIAIVDERTKRELLGRCPGPYFIVGAVVSANE